MSSSQHMVCFLLYACLAASGYQTLHSSQLLALMKDLFAFGDKDGITDSQLFFQEWRTDFTSSFKLSRLVLSLPRYHRPSSGTVLSCQDCPLASAWPPSLQFWPLWSKITVPAGPSRHRFKMSLLTQSKSLLLASAWSLNFLAWKIDRARSEGHLWL